MISRLRSVRLTWPQIALIAAASAIATVVVIHAGTRRDHIPSAELSALRRRVIVHTSTVPPAGSHVAQAASAPASGSAPPAAAVDDSPLPSSPVDDGAATSSDGTTGDDRWAATTGRPTRAPA